MVAVEDRRFYRTSASIRSAWSARLYLGQARPVALAATSTITQQLARNVFLNSNRTFDRKLREAVLAMALEAKFSKQQILELYLNKVYFGGGAYGIDSASRKFFSHPATRATIAEAAIIAGMVKAPSRYSPTADVDAAVDRANVVLDLMRDQRQISASEAAAVDLARSSSAARKGRTRSATSPTGRCRSSTCCCPTATPSRSRCGPRSILGMQRAATAGGHRQRARGARRARWSASTATARSWRWSAARTT